MFTDIEDFKAFIDWAISRQIKTIKVDGIELEVSEIKYAAAAVEGSQESYKERTPSSKRFIDDEEATSDDDDLLYYSSGG